MNMEVVRYEVMKLFGKKLFLIFFLLLLICNHLLLYIYEKNSKEFFYIHEQNEKYQAFLMGNQTVDTDGYYQQESEEQKVYQTVYHEFINEMGQRAAGMQDIPIFKDESSYVYRNLAKSVADFVPFSEIELTIDNCHGMNAAAEYDSSILFVLIFLAILCYYVLFWERDRNLLLLLKCSEKGHVPLAVSKLVTMIAATALFVILLECSTIFTIGWMYGYGDINRTIQSVPIFQNCTYALTVREVLVFIVMVRVFVSIVLVCFLFFVGTLFKNEILASAFSVILLGSEYFFSKIFSISGTFGGIKSINPFYCWNMGKVLGEYYNLNVFGYPVGKNRIAVLVSVLLISVFTTAGIIFFHKTCQIKMESRLEILLQWIRKKTSFLNHGHGLVYYEFYKVMILQKKGIVLALLLFWLISENFGVFEVRYYGDAKVASYHVYMNRLHGAVTENTYAGIEEEAVNLERMRQKISSQETDEAKRRVYAAQLEMYEGGFLLVQRQFAGLGAKPGNIREKYLLDELAYMELWNDTKTDIALWFSGAAVILFFLSGIYSIDEKKGVMPLVRSTRNGRKYLKKSKNCCVGICAGMTFFVMELPLFLKYYKIDRFSTTMQRLCDFTMNDFSSNITLKTMLVCVFLLKAVSFYIVVICGRKLSEMIKNDMVIMIAGIGLSGMTAMVLYYFQWDFNILFLMGTGS